MEDVFGQHSILYIILIGFFAGLLARAVMPGRQSYGFIMTTLLGVGGAVVATYGGQALDLYGPGERARFLGAVVGALVLLVIAGLLRRRE